MVRLTLNGVKIEGLISMGTTSYFIEQAKNYSSHATDQDFVVYRESDLLKGHQTADSPSPLASKVANEIVTANKKVTDARYNKSSGSDTTVKFANAASATTLMRYRVLRLRTDADYEYLQHFGPTQSLNDYYQTLSAANANILEILNLVEGVYERDAEITFSVVEQFGWRFQDPFGPRPNFPYVHQNFRDWMEVNEPTAEGRRDYTMLFTGKDAGANLTYEGYVCTWPAFAYTVIVRDYLFYGGNYRYNATAHEISHALGGSHVVEGTPGLGEYAVSSYPDCYNSIMGPDSPNQLDSSGQVRICPFTISQFQQHLSLDDCLETEIK